MATKEELMAVFADTMQWCREHERLAESIKNAVKGTVIYREGVLALPEKRDGAEISVTRERSFAAALRLKGLYPDKRVAVHNFASATNPGGGVVNGSRAQEECLCRTSTLYPVLHTEDNWQNYYAYHRRRQDTRYTDRIIYTPGIVVCKTDEDLPARMDEADWREVDVLTCAAPNLRMGTGRAVKDAELFALHKKRAEAMLACAAQEKADILVLGAFGCGAFRNDPEVVAAAYKETLAKMSGYFAQLVFAIYCPPQETRNYEAFARVIRDGSDWHIFIYLLYLSQILI